MNNTLVFSCPHCRCRVIVSESDTNCCIFRHAVLKSTGRPINPHANKDRCDKLVKDDKVYGCAKPFELIKTVDISGNKSWTAVACGYK